ncbi:MAG: rhamnogalacturonan acetylesterase [Bacteroidales bacterium]|nr:rhamnogalacturonan acetylesterase [Bacteroidales bacterium]
MKVFPAAWPNLKPAFILILFMLLSAFSAPERKVHVFMIGDSTMADKKISKYPETGWGTPFKIFFDSTVVIENHAKNGRSTKSFIAENRWSEVYKKLEPGDYVIIEFGHNDESVQKKERYATPDQYRENLKRFIRETEEKGAQAILMTPVSRRRFDDAGNIELTHAEYSPLVEEVAKETHTPFIDMDSLTRELYQQFGADQSKWLFLQLEAGEHPNYPEGKRDNTHFNELGARLVAQLALREIKKLGFEINDHIVNPGNQNH